MEVAIIHGTSFNVSEVFSDDEQPQVQYIAEVSKVNKFGYFEITVYGDERHFKRHLADCYDLQGYCLTGMIKGLMMKGPETFMLNVKGLSEEVYFIRKSSETGYSYVARRRVDGKYTDDITLAWFTFDKEQAERFATNLTMKHLTVFEAVSAEQEIQLDSYMEV